MELNNFAVIPFHESVSWKVGHLLGKSVTQTIFHSSTKVGQILRSVNDNLGLRVPGLY